MTGQLHCPLRCMRAIGEQHVHQCSTKRYKDLDSWLDGRVLSQDANSRRDRKERRGARRLLTFALGRARRAAGRSPIGTNHRFWRFRPRTTIRHPSCLCQEKQRISCTEDRDSELIGDSLPP